MVNRLMGSNFSWEMNDGNLPMWKKIDKTMFLILFLEKVNICLEKRCGSTGWRFYILQILLEKREIYFDGLSSIVGLEKSLLSKRLSRMKMEGLIYVDRCFFDKRRRVIGLTSHGRLVAEMELSRVNGYSATEISPEVQILLIRIFLKILNF